MRRAYQYQEQKEEHEDNHNEDIMTNKGQKNKEPQLVIPINTQPQKTTPKTQQ
jgi:hypothetical protein